MKKKELPGLSPSGMSYDELAEYLQCSPRQVRNLLKKHRDIIQPVRYSHKTVRFALPQVMALAERRFIQVLMRCDENREQVKRIEESRMLVQRMPSLGVLGDTSQAIRGSGKWALWWLTIGQDEAAAPFASKGKPTDYLRQAATYLQ